MAPLDDTLRVDERPRPPAAPGQGEPQPRERGGFVDFDAPPSRSRRRSRFNPRYARIFIRAVGPLLILGLWQLISTAGVISTDVLPPPSTVAQTLVDLISSGQLADDLRISLQRAVIGLAIGLFLGISCGLLSGLSRIGEELLDSSLQMMRMVPFLALVPLFLVWFGIGETPKIALIAAACVFPAYLYTYAGVRGVDAKLVEAGRVFGLRRPALVKTIVLPLALPSILYGVRYAMGVSLLALVAAEQVNATSGIGYLVMNAGTIFRTDIIIAGVLVYAILGIAIDLFMRGVERLLLPWNVSFVR